MPLIANRYLPTGNAAWGGMAEVHECLDQNLSRKVMLKRVPDTADLPRLLDEQKALLRLRSKHVVQLLDVISFRHNGNDIRCLVLEHIAGTDLDQIKFTPNEDFQKTLWQIASGIADIHRAGIIHRDIKPNNIRRDENGVVKIFDFGLAREVGKDDKTKSITGTLGFMAPELFGSTTISFSPAVDTYAFARTALSLLGIQPSNKTPAAIPPGLIAQNLPALNPNVAKTLEACLSIDPAKRPSMHDTVDVLARDFLKDKHRARVGTAEKANELDASHRTVTLKFANARSSLTIHYDGYYFIVTDVSGNVFVNNKPVNVGTLMLSACVITFGLEGERRAFATFDISRPEVMA